MLAARDLHGCERGLIKRDCLTDPIGFTTFGSYLKKEFNKREFSYPDYQDYQQNSVFDGSCLYRRRRCDLEW
jgi:hypothetical protein